MPNNIIKCEGATLYEVAGKDGNKVIFDEVTTPKAGMPYIFIANQEVVKFFCGTDEAAIAGNYNSLYVYDLVKEMFEFIINYEGVIPGASAIECGNYLDLNLSMAKFYAKKYIKEVLENFTEEKYIYK